MDQSVINFACYENSVEFLGLVEASLPDVSMLTQTVSGAGIAGNIETPIMGHVDTMTLGLSFQTTCDAAVKLNEPRLHTIDLRAPQQVEDPTAGTIKTQEVKHIFVLVPTTFKGGKVAPASPTDGSGEYAVRYWAIYIDGVKKQEVDPMNNIFYVNGTDYLAGVRAALGK